MAPQFKATKGLSLSLLSRCISLATSSLPVPLSPEISTLARVGATLVINLYRCCMESELPYSSPQRIMTSDAAAWRMQSCSSFCAWKGVPF